MAKQEFKSQSSDSNGRVPVFGQPVYQIVENNLSNVVKIIGEYGHTNSLVYYAVNAIKVMKLEYADETLKKIVINRDMVSTEEEPRSLEIRLDIEKNFNGPQDAATTFVDEEAANLVAARLNKARKSECLKLADAINRGLSEYDKIIAICEGKNVTI